MKTVHLNFEGKKYPYIETMGAMLSFKSETGIEPTAIAANDTENNLKYIYHVVRAQCRRNGEEFKYSFEEFADRLEYGDYIQLLTDLNQVIMEQMAAKDEASSKND